jgi:hypothetical protein
MGARLAGASELTTPTRPSGGFHTGAALNLFGVLGTEVLDGFFVEFADLDLFFFGFAFGDHRVCSFGFLNHYWQNLQI